MRLREVGLQLGFRTDPKRTTYNEPYDLPESR